MLDPEKWLRDRGFSDGRHSAMHAAEVGLRIEEIAAWTSDLLRAYGADLLLEALRRVKANGEECAMLAVMLDPERRRRSRKDMANESAFIQRLLRALAFTPAVVHGVEALFGNKSGVDKREAAASFVTSALSLNDAVAAGSVVNEAQFRAGVDQVINGVVACLNASAWHKLEGRHAKAK